MEDMPRNRHFFPVSIHRSRAWVILSHRFHNDKEENRIEFFFIPHTIHRDGQGRGVIMKVCKVFLTLVFFFALLSGLSAQPVISQKQDIAIFSLGYYGWNIPSQALGSIDGEIQKVFSDLGRFTILGVTQRFSSSDINSFIDAVKRSKQSTFTMPV